jgi:hypothetical protein
MKLKNQLKMIMLIGSIGLTSCDNAVDEVVEMIEEEMVDPCETPVLFGETILPLIELKCAPCHIGEDAERGQLNTFATISEKAAQVKTRTGNRSMPQQGSLTDKQIQDIACWVDAGALDN